MKKAWKLAVLLLLVMAVLLGVAGCKKKEPAKLTVWVPARDAYIGPDEQKKAQEEWYISQAFRRFEKANPGTTVVMSTAPVS